MGNKELRFQTPKKIFQEERVTVIKASSVT